MLPKTVRTRCKPRCAPTGKALEKKIRSRPDDVADNAFDAYDFHLVGLAQCKSKDVGVIEQRIAPWSTNETLTASEAWRVARANY